jgi:pseudouridine-5'-phosphate glycosidase/sugar/nucleoside kinase (ribokinase family)
MMVHRFRCSSRLRPAAAERRFLSSFPRLLLSDPVKSALANHDPVVALESTIVAHGMPYPTNLEVATAVESLLQKAGVTPATICIYKGTPQIGLSNQQLHELSLAGQHALKCSTRELCLLAGASNPPTWGATTVASTMTLAHLAGIPTFVTGGIGGVHRKGEITMDVSTDVTELSRTPVVVVSAGIKSILDIAKTLEVLETLGVPTLSYQTNDFPAFFHPSSGIRSPARVDSAIEIAQYYHAARRLGLQHGMLVAVPNTNDAAGAAVEVAIQAALVESEKLEISGRDLTPFILKRVAEETSGESLKSNVALVLNNAKVGAEIAIAIAKQQNQQPMILQAHLLNASKPPKTIIPVAAKFPAVMVLGGAVVDLVAKPTKLMLKTSSPGITVESDGGVGRNVAEALGRLGTNVTFVTAIGEDSRGEGLLERLVGVGHLATTVPSGRTAVYVSMLDDRGDLLTAVADMDVLAHIQAPTIEELEGVKYLLMDANPPLVVLKRAVENAVRTKTIVCFEPTSVPKAKEVARNKELFSHFQYAFPNLDECRVMAEMLSGENVIDGDDQNVHRLAKAVLDAMHPEQACLVVTMGDKGILLVKRHPKKQDNIMDDDITYDRIPAQPMQVENSTGAGDSLCGAFMYALVQGKSELEAVKFGMEAAALSLKCSDRAVSTELNTLKLAS